MVERLFKVILTSFISRHLRSKKLTTRQ